MDILTTLEQKETWHTFLQYRKESHRLSDREATELEAFIEQQAYLPIIHRIRNNDPFPHPRRAEISKQSTSKKRIVYVYPREESLVLKLMTHLLLRRYDFLFPPCLYSFRAGHGAKEAIRYLTNTAQIDQQWCYKVDIRNYFNSVPVEQLLPQLRQILQDEPPLYDFLAQLLRDPFVYHNGQLISEEKGIMAGTPISTFLANVYLLSLDRLFYENRWLYARYSDDIIIFAPTEKELVRRQSLIEQTLHDQQLSINPDKEIWTPPGQQWVFLGIACQNGVIDVAPVSVNKIKAKMRRKTRALQRWAARKNISGIHAAKAFIRIFNQKLFENPISNDLTWARWFFPLINADHSLHIIDQYAQQCIRYLATGTHTKASYNFRYEQMKELGYISLVHRYYQHKNTDNLEETVD